MIRKDIALLLKEKRKERNLTLEEAANLLGVSKSTYRDYENEVLLIKNMKIEKIIPLAIYLDMLPNDLFEIDQTIELVKFNKYQFKEIMINVLRCSVEGLNEDDKKYLIRTLNLIID